MEDRTSAGLYLEMSERSAEAYRADRLAAVRKLDGVSQVTLWSNQKPGRDDFPRTIPEFRTLAVYEVDHAFESPAHDDAMQAHHFVRTIRPAQGILGEGPTLGLELVLVTASSPELKQRLRDWADFFHIREIAAAAIPGMTMITPYENKSAESPCFMHLYEMDRADAETTFREMAPITIDRIRRRDGKETVEAWMNDAALRIDYVNSFTRMNIDD